MTKPIVDKVISYCKRKAKDFISIEDLIDNAEKKFPVKLFYDNKIKLKGQRYVLSIHYISNLTEVPQGYVEIPVENLAEPFDSKVCWVQ
jgi:hypothetical protein